MSQPANSPPSVQSTARTRLTGQVMVAMGVGLFLFVAAIVGLPFLGKTDSPGVRDCVSTGWSREFLDLSIPWEYRLADGKPTAPLVFFQLVVIAKIPASGGLNIHLTPAGDASSEIVTNVDATSFQISRESPAILRRVPFPSKPDDKRELRIERHSQGWFFFVDNQQLARIPDPARRELTKIRITTSRGGTITPIGQVILEELRPRDRSPREDSGSRE